MSALSVLYLVLPFPLAFILHDAEEAIVQHRWMLSHRYIFEDKYPRIKPLFKYLSSLDTQSFVIAALEEFVILILCTCYVLIQGNYCVEIWSALFIAFSFHQIVHIMQAIVLRSYVPGLITSVLLIPYSHAKHLVCYERSRTIPMGRCRNYIYGNESDICPLDWENMSQDTFCTQLSKRHNDYGQQTFSYRNGSHLGHWP